MFAISSSMCYSRWTARGLDQAGGKAFQVAREGLVHFYFLNRPSRFGRQ